MSFSSTRIHRLARFIAEPYRLPLDKRSIFKAAMTLTKNTENAEKQNPPPDLTFLDVRQAGRDDQKVFDKFVIADPM
ncbi:hypothetical protein C2E19_10895 [Pseudomonas sp. DTU12.3]|jgi:hypothetical protein|nr:hypothetical protein C2E19_10895 [Pseudomonas sp. DTU12.3]